MNILGCSEAPAGGPVVPNPAEAPVQGAFAALMSAAPEAASVPEQTVKDAPSECLAASLRQQILQPVGAQISAEVPTVSVEKADTPDAPVVIEPVRGVRGKVQPASDPTTVPVALQATPVVQAPVVQPEIEDPTRPAAQGGEPHQAPAQAPVQSKARATAQPRTQTPAQPQAQTPA
ncbi:hypothetical protein JST97_38745, partial [bacterium]|nr:hypothetical protein [bacterium]